MPRRSIRRDRFLSRRVPALQPAFLALPLSPIPAGLHSNLSLVEAREFSHRNKVESFRQR